MLIQTNSISKDIFTPTQEELVAVRNGIQSNRFGGIDWTLIDSFEKFVPALCTVLNNRPRIHIQHYTVNGKCIPILYQELLDAQLMRDIWDTAARLSLSSSIKTAAPDEPALFSLDIVRTMKSWALAESVSGNKPKEAEATSKARMSCKEAERIGSSLLKRKGKHFSKLSESAQAEAVGCSWATWSKTPTCRKIKNQKEIRTKAGINAVHLSAKVLSTQKDSRELEPHEEFDNSEVIERLIKEQTQDDRTRVIRKKV